MNRALIVLAVLAWVAVTSLAQPTPPATPAVHAPDGLAVSGYDPVAYFTESRARPGQPQFEHIWSGVRWRFASAAHRDAFVANPAKYAPQYGGYCAFAVSRNYTYKADPEAWRIVDGRLYLNYDKRVQERWAEELAANIAKGDAHWPSVLTAPKKN